ncbi:hypothetical protein, partial [Curtobacterium sp. MMLR14_010]|uniref:hypothetical protein n=1 Tax=Curtobacterium sp. MMLR14_010 TaxID=1898743 RepID=UPI001C311CF3
MEGRWPFLFSPLEPDSTCWPVRDGLGRHSVTQGAHNDTADDRRRSSSGTHEEQRWRTTTNGGTTATTSVGDDPVGTATVRLDAMGLRVEARAAAVVVGRLALVSSSVAKATDGTVPSGTATGRRGMATGLRGRIVLRATMLRGVVSGTVASGPTGRHGGGTATTPDARLGRVARDRIVRPDPTVPAVMGIVRSARIVRVV